MSRGFPTLAVLILLGLAFNPPAGARPGQRVPLLQAHYWYTGSVTLEGDAPAEGEPPLPPLTLSSHTLRLRGLIGYPFFGGATLLAVLLQYDVTWASARLGDAPWQLASLHAPSLNVGVIQRLGPRWGLLGYVMGGIGSDMEAVTSEDLRFTVGLGATFRPSDRLSLAFGAMFTTAMFVPLPLPLFHLDYQRGGLVLDLRIPQSAELWWRRDPWELGLRFAVLNLRYGLHQAGRVSDDLNAINVTAGPVLRRRLFAPLFAEVCGGYNARFFRLVQDGRRAYQDLRLEGYFVTVGLGLMIEVGGTRKPDPRGAPNEGR